MLCPSCGHFGSRVLDSRPSNENRSIRRRRECDSCNQRFTTFEIVEETPIIVVKRMEREKSLAEKKFYVD